MKHHGHGGYIRGQRVKVSFTRWSAPMFSESAFEVCGQIQTGSWMYKPTGEQTYNTMPLIVGPGAATSPINSLQH